MNTSSFRHNRQSFFRFPWVGRRYGRQAFKDYLTRLNQNQGLARFDIETVIEQHHTVALFGTLQASALSTGNSDTWEFAIKLDFQDGQIARYHLYEDSYAAAAMHRQSGSWTVENAENRGQTRRIP